MLESTPKVRTASLFSLGERIGFLKSHIKARRLKFQSLAMEQDQDYAELAILLDQYFRKKNEKVD